MVTFFPSDPQLPRVFLDASVIIAGVGSKTGASNAILGLCEIGFLRPASHPTMSLQSQPPVPQRLHHLDHDVGSGFNRVVKILARLRCFKVPARDGVRTFD